MPIAVICPSCKAQFRVSEKFAGQKGPCPKCKGVIEIPQPDDVVVHAPEEYAGGGKDSQGRAAAKPILRSEAGVSPVLVTAVIGGAIAAFAIAGFGGKFFRDSAPLLVAGLAAVSIPVSVGGYSILRDDELEPYRGKWLWLRAGIVGLAYCGLCGAFWAIRANWLTPEFMAANFWTWIFILPPFAVVGASIAWACLDIEWGGGIFHFGLFVLVTLGLRFAIGLPAVWQAATPAAA